MPGELAYGPVALAYLATDPEERDPKGPFDLVFPKMTKYSTVG